MQLFVGAVFHCAALFHDVNAVGTDDLDAAVEDDDHLATLLDGFQAVLNLLGGDGVERGGGLVEEDDGSHI